jgi:hypothetical protein
VRQDKQVRQVLLVQPVKQELLALLDKQVLLVQPVLLVQRVKQELPVQLGHSYPVKLLMEAR